MHQHIINASIQVVPIGTNKHPYVWVDEAISIIQQSGLKYTVGAFGTDIEGTYTEVMKIIEDINEYLYKQACEEWIVNCQIQFRAGSDITIDEKIKKY
jgi:uncharacterized protein (TIGR00106 family)